jgi:hypothetical protein
MKGSIAAVAALLFAGGANAGSLGINYYETPTTSTGDFGPCCSSPPATLEGITVGAPLGPDGLPVNHFAGLGLAGHRARKTVRLAV